MNKVQIKMITDALDNEHELTEWESEFINALAEKDNEVYDLSTKQQSILNRINTTLIHKGCI